MEVTLAWIKGKRVNGLRRMISNEATFEMPVITSTVQYDSELKLDPEEWFCLDDFNNSDYKIDVISKDEATLLASTLITKDEFQNIKYLVHYIDTGIFMFQAILKSRLIKNKMFAFRNEPEIVDDEVLIIIQDTPDAIFNTNENKLYFRDLSRISHIFPSIGELYREATDTEVRNFLQADYLNVDAAFDSSKVSVPNRKKIALFGAVYQGLNNEQKEDFKQYLMQYNPNFEIEENDGKDIFGIKSDEDIRCLMSACAERYYTTPITNRQMLARSVQSVQ